MVQKGFYLLEKAMSGCHHFGLLCFVQLFNIKVSSLGKLITVLTLVYSSVQYYVVCSYLQSICYNEYFSVDYYRGSVRVKYTVRLYSITQPTFILSSQDILCNCCCS